MAAKVKLDCKHIGVDALFRLFTRSEKDPISLILDVRPQKDFKVSHVLLSYNVRLTANGRALVDYSKNTYKIKWTQEVWWNSDVTVVGDQGLNSHHPVIAFLAAEGRCRSLAYYKDGVAEFEKSYPFLVGSSTKAHRGLVYPSQIVDRQLYLGDWAMAEDVEKLRQLGIGRVITIHNNPGNLKLPPDLKHLAIEAADVPSTDVSRFFNAAYEFVEMGNSKGHATLLHCGAGVSRSATLAAAYLMRKHRWSADRALRHLLERRSKICPNEGFWRQLCALEEPLGIPAKDRSNVDKPVVVDESYGTMDFKKLAADAAGTRVDVRISGVAPASSDVERRSRPDAPSSHSHRGGGQHKDGDGIAHEALRGKRHRDDDRGRGGDERDVRRRRDERESGGDHAQCRDGDRDRDKRDERSRGNKQAAGRGDTLSANEARQSKKAAPGILLKVVKDGDAKGTVEIPTLKRHARCVFGRAPDVDVKLDHASISRQHAELTVDGAGAVFLCDMGSAHGTNINGMWVKANQPKELKIGSQFRFGASTRSYVVEAINVAK